MSVCAEGALAPDSWTSFTFPDDPRPARWIAAGAGARQLRRRPSRPSQDPRPRAPRRRRARRHVRRDDVRSASAARRPARQGAAAADDQGAEARGDRRRRRAGRGDRALHARAVAAGIPKRSCGPCSSTGCASPRSGSARTFCSATIAPATSRCCASLGARYGFKAEKIDPVRYKDFVVSSTRIRRLIGEGRVDEAGALLGHQYFIDGTVVQRRPARPDDRLSDREPLHRERAAAAARRLCDDRARSASIVHPSVTNIGVAADRGRRPGATVDRDAHLQLRSRSVRRADPRRLRAAAARRAGVRVAGRAARRRSPPTASARACCSIAFRCRIRRSCPIRSSSSPSTCPASRRSTRMLGDLAALRPGARRLRSRRRSTRSPAQLGAALTERAASGRRRCEVQFRARGRRARDRRRVRRPAATGAPPAPLPASVSRSDASVQHPDPQRGDLRAGHPATPCGCTPAA